MAGLGHKIWATDDVLTAVDLNGYLADQTVMVFASAAARTAGITYPTKGMVTTLSDSDTLWRYDGSTWVNIPTASTGTAAYAINAGSAVNAGTASDSVRIAGSKVFVQAGTPTAEATDDLWFY